MGNTSGVNFFIAAVYTFFQHFCTFFNPFQAPCLFLDPLKTSKNQGLSEFSNVFRGNRKIIGMKWVKYSIFSEIFFQAV